MVSLWFIYVNSVFLNCVDCSWGSIIQLRGTYCKKVKSKASNLFTWMVDVRYVPLIFALSVQM